MMSRRRLCLIVLLTSLLSVSAARAEDDLFKALGGREGTAAIAKLSIDKALKDPRIQHSFDEANPKRVARLIGIQICQISGGDCVYDGRSMEESHRKLTINQAQFNALVEDMQDAMDELGIPYFAQNRLLALLAPMQRDIIRR